MRGNYSQQAYLQKRLRRSLKNELSIEDNFPLMATVAENSF